MKNKNVFMYVLGSLIALGFFAVLVVAFKIEMPTGNKDILLILLGVLGAKFGDVVAYFFGSSKGSADKSELMKK